MSIRKVIIFLVVLALSLSGLVFAGASPASAEAKKHEKASESKKEDKSKGHKKEEKKEEKPAEHKKPEKKAEATEGSEKGASVPPEAVIKIREKQRQLRREKIEKEKAERQAQGPIVERDLTEEEMAGPAQPKPETAQAAATPTLHTNSAFDAKKKLDDELSSAGAVDAVLILDSSGSMRRTDPNRLRDQGAKLFSRFLDSKDRVAIYQFDSEPKELLPFTYVSEDQIPVIDKAINAVSSDGGFTDIQKAVKQAVEALIYNGRADAIKAVVLLSDGKMDPRPSRGTAKQFIDEMMNSDLPLYRKRQIKLYTLYFSEEADKELLGKIAQATGGMNWFAASVDGIHKRFSDLFLSMKKPQVVTLDPNGFEMTAGVEEATFYVSRKREESEKLVLSDPYGKQYKSDNLPPGTKWYKAEQFDIITVRNPVEGVWSVEGVEAKEGFATLLTNIRLQVQWPEDRFKLGDKVRLVSRVTQDGKVLSEPQIKDLLFFSYKVINTDNGQVIAEGDLTDRGQTGDQLAGDNLYSTVVELGQEGDFKALIMARSPTFTRQQVIPFEVSKELITLGIKKFKQEGNIESAEDAFYVELARTALDWKDLKVGLEVKKTGTEEVKSFEMLPLPGSTREYQLPTAAIKEGGNYQLAAALKGIDKNKELREGRSNNISFVVAEVKPQEEVHEEKPVEPEKPEEPAGPGMFDREPATATGAIYSSVMLLWITSFLGLALWRFGKQRVESVQALAEYELPAILVDRLVQIRSSASKIKRQPAKDDLDFLEELNLIKNESVGITSDLGTDWVLGEEDIKKAKEQLASKEGEGQEEVKENSLEDQSSVEEVKSEEPTNTDPASDGVSESIPPESPVAEEKVDSPEVEEAPAEAAEPQKEETAAAEQKENEPEAVSKDEAEKLAEQMLADLGKNQ